MKHKSFFQGVLGGLIGAMIGIPLLAFAVGFVTPDGFLNMDGNPVQFFARENNTLRIGTAGTGDLEFFTGDTLRQSIDGSTGAMVF